MEQKFTLRRFNQILLAFLLFFGTLYLAKVFIVPLAIGGLFAMLLTPACNKLEKKGLHPTVAALLCVIAVVIILVVVIALLIDQLTALAYDLPALDQRLTDLLDKARLFVKDTFEVPRKKQNEYLEQSLRSYLQYAGLYLRNLLLFASSLLLNFVIIMSYTLLFILYRKRLKTFVSRLTSKYDTDARAIVSKISTVASSYISGVFLVVMILSVVNTIGLMVIGIEHALLFGLMAGLLNIIPYLGSLAGSLIPVVFALLTKDSLITPLLVALFFLVVQQVESYILTPTITGGKVKLNPMATLIVLLLGSAIWGIAGMILFVPFLGIAKVIFDNIPSLHPFGYVLGRNGDEEG